MNNLKIDEFSKCFNCRYCLELLVRPITLPCGASICEKHLSLCIRDLNDKCFLCNENHHDVIYNVNEALSKMLELHINSIKLSPKFDACKLNIDKSKEFLNELDMIAKDPENYVYEYFEGIKRKVDIHREEMKLEIDQFSDKLIEQINQTRNDCYKLSTKIDKLTADITLHKSELNILIQKVDTFNIKDDEYDEILSQLNKLSPKLEDILDEYKYSLIGDKDYEFKVEVMNLDKACGSFISNLKEKVCLYYKLIITGYK